MDWKTPVLGAVSNKSMMDYRMIHGDDRDMSLVPLYIQEREIKHLQKHAIIYPRMAISCLAEMMWFVPIINVDELYSGGELLRACNLKIKHIKELDPRIKDDSFEDKALILTSHSLAKQEFYHKLH